MRAVIRHFETLVSLGEWVGVGIIGSQEVKKLIRRQSCVQECVSRSDMGRGGCEMSRGQAKLGSQGSSRPLGSAECDGLFPEVSLILSISILRLVKS